MTRAISGLLALLGAMLGSACGDVAVEDKTPDYRYRLTVEVETPEGIKTGSSVIEVKTDRASEYSIPNPGALRRRVRGEAVAVDLPNGRTLFALLRSEDNVDWATNIMFILAPDGRSEDGDRFLGRFENMLAMRREIALPARLGAYNPNLREMSGRPMLVTFGDLDDPTSVERVDPDDLAATVGEGISLKRITVQMTDDPVTSVLGRKLRWLPSTHGTLLKHPSGVAIGDLPIEYQIGKIGFVREDKQ